MSTVLYIQASPRGSRSRSIKVAEAFFDAYRREHPDDRIDTLNVHEADLPPFDGPVLQAKYNILQGLSHSPKEQAAWKAVETHIERFKAADKYVIAAAMWNFSIPYRLKQYIDILVQPGYTFSYDPQSGYVGLVTGKPMVVFSARGGDYSSAEAKEADMQGPYIELIMGFIGFKDIRFVTIEPTLMDGPEVAEQKTQTAISQARILARTF